LQGTSTPQHTVCSDEFTGAPSPPAKASILYLYLCLLRPLQTLLSIQETSHHAFVANFKVIRPKTQTVIMKPVTVLPLLAGLAQSAPSELQDRQSSCPKVHVYGARETTVPQGYGTSQGLVNMVTQAYPGATAEAIVYPACGGQSNCGGVSYENSASQGTAAVVKAVTSFNQRVRALYSAIVYSCCLVVIRLTSVAVSRYQDCIDWLFPG
jgi:hypothetical protein